MKGDTGSKHPFEVYQRKQAKKTTISHHTSIQIEQGIIMRLYNSKQTAAHHPSKQANSQ